MEVTISPKLEQFAQKQVEAGHFASIAEVFEASLREMMLNVDFDDEDEIAAIAEADRQISVGETFSLSEVRQEFLGK